MRTDELISLIFEHDVEHRKGWRPSDHGGDMPDESLTFLRDETNELSEALRILREKRSHHSRHSTSVEEVDVKYELGDVFNCVLVLARQAGMTIHDLDAYASAKLLARYPKLHEHIS